MSVGKVRASPGLRGANPRGPLLSVNVGPPREIEWKGKTIREAVWKDLIRGRHKVVRLNLDGDGQGVLQDHGGLCVLAASQSSLLSPLPDISA